MSGPDPSADYYRALGVREQATPDEIKRAYRTLAKQFHPDSTGGDKVKEARFKEISVAYEVLGDPDKRGTYDQLRQLRTATTGGASRGAGGGDPIFDLGDLFSQFLGAEHNPSMGPRSRSGYRRRSDDARSGPVPGARQPGQPLEVFTLASDGSHLRVDGADVHSDVRVPFWKAILGALAHVATIDGMAEIKIPPSTSSGRKLRLRGKGIADPATAERGDHYVTVQIDVPDEADTDDELKAAISKIAERLLARGRARAR